MRLAVALFLLLSSAALLVHSVMNKDRLEAAGVDYTMTRNNGAIGLAFGVVLLVYALSDA